MKLPPIWLVLLAGFLGYLSGSFLMGCLIGGILGFGWAVISK